MSTTPIVISFTPSAGAAAKTVTLPAVSTISLTPISLIAQIPSSFYNGGTVGLTLMSTPTVLIDNYADLTKVSGFTIGTSFTFNLVFVKRYVINNAQDTNSATNAILLDYLPGVTYDPAPADGSAPFPSRVKLVNDALNEFNNLITAYNTANSTSQGIYTLLVSATGTSTLTLNTGSNLDKNIYWGMYVPSNPNSIMSGNFVQPGNYVMDIVQHYIVNVPRGTSPFVTETLKNQTAAALISAAGVTMQSNPFPALFLHSAGTTDATLATNIIANTTAVAGNTYDIIIVYSYTCVLPATNTTAAVTTSIKTLEAQTPDYLLRQLITASVITGSSSAWALQPQNPVGAPLQNQLLSLDPTIIYNIVAVVSIAVDYTGNVSGAATITVRTINTATVEEFLADPSLAPIFQNTPTGQMVVMCGNKGDTTTFFSPAALISAVTAKLVSTYSQTAPNYTLYWGTLNYNTITVNYSGSAVQYIDHWPQTDKYVNVVIGAVAFFGLTQTTKLNFALFDTVSTYKQYGFNFDSSQGVTKSVTAGDSTTLTLQNLMPINMANESATQGPSVWVPASFSIGDALKYFKDASSHNSSYLPLASISSGNDWQLAELGTPGATTDLSATAGPVYLPWQTIATASPDLNYVAVKLHVGDTTLHVDGFAATHLGAVCNNLTALQYQQWAQHLFPSLKIGKDGLVTSMKGTNVVPAYTVTATNSIVPTLNDTALAGGTNDVYVQQGMEIIVNAPATVTRTPIDTVLPQSFTTYDIINYALPIFGLTGITSYALYEKNDPAQQTLDIMEQMSAISASFGDDPLPLQMFASDYVRVTISYNGSNSVLLPMPVSCTIASMIDVAEQTLGLSSGTLEVVTPSTKSTPIMLTDLLSAYTTPSTTAGGVGSASFNVQTIVKTNVIFYDSQTGFIALSKKISQSLLISQVVSIYAAAMKIPASYLIQFFTLHTNVLAASTAQLASFERALLPADNGNLDPNDSTPVTTVVEFNVVKTLQTQNITVQPLFNNGASISVTVALYSTAAQLAQAAVTAFGGLSSSATFGVALAGTSSALSATTTVSSSNTYKLVETTSPAIYAFATINYVDRTQTSVSSVVLASTALNALSGFTPRFETLSTSVGGAAIADTTVTVAATLASIGVTTGQLSLFDSLKPAITVHVSYNGVLSGKTIPINSTIAQMLTAFAITGNVTVTEVSTSKVASPSAFVLDFSSPYTFTVTINPTTFPVIVNYGAQSTTVQATAAATVSQVIALAVSALGLDATAQYSMSLTANGAVLSPASVQSWSTVTNVYMSLSSGFSSQTLIVVGSVGGLAALAGLLMFSS